MFGRASSPYVLSFDRARCAMSFEEVVSSSIGLRSAGPKRLSEALGIIFNIRAAGMPVGPILGVLFQV